MSQVITICATCQLGKSDMAEVLARALPDWVVAKRDCMSGCRRPSTLAFRAPGKTAYLFGDLSAEDLPMILRFAASYATSTTGDFEDARPFGALRTKVIARIPG